uniref:Pentatricopeptide repeat-containing protein At5g06540 n=1 Tax=Anthurium amnicola TaxID=1678845 RepID=A0A1D1XRX0_9ARAE
MRSGRSSPLVERTLCLKSPKLLLLETCSGLSQLKAIHAHMVRTHIIADVFCASRLLAFCVDPPPSAPKQPLWDYAERLFSQVERPNLFMYNAMIRGSAGGGNPPRSLYLYRQMQGRGIQPDNLTYPFVLKACGRWCCGEAGRLVHCRVLRRGFELDGFVQSSLLHMYASWGDAGAASRVFGEIKLPDVVIWTSMIDVYGKCGDIDSARQMFDKMPERNVVTWSSMICAYTKNENFSEALDLFHVMESEKVVPNEAAMVSVLSSCASLGALEQGERAHEYIVQNNLTSNLILGTALVNMYAKCGDVQQAIRIFEQLPEKDWLSWTTVIAGLAMHGYARMSLDYFSKMVKARVTPREITFTAVLSACSHGGLVERGFELFESMKKDYRMEPRKEHYGCMVDLLGRAGRLEEAEKFVLKLPVKPDASIWGALLGACRIHKNVEMGKRVGKILTMLQPEHSGYYVLMSNIYATASQWEGVTELRHAMSERGVKKSPGHSLLEMDGRVHRFVMGDKSHPEIEKIEEMWEEIVGRIRSIGYVGNTSDVLFDIEEEEKESALAKHSEKLAIAFGIMKTGTGSVIRIIKNLRVCEDCHEVTKFVSEVYDCKFIVRDRNRFHHVMGGKCSCMDYW